MIFKPNLSVPAERIFLEASFRLFQCYP